MRAIAFKIRISNFENDDFNCFQQLDRPAGRAKANFLKLTPQKSTQTTAPKQTTQKTPSKKLPSEKNLRKKPPKMTSRWSETSILEKKKNRPVGWRQGDILPCKCHNSSTYSFRKMWYLMLNKPVCLATIYKACCFTQELIVSEKSDRVFEKK